jgi:hypothetical protein
MAPGRKRDDENGWKRGVGAYSSNYAKFDSPEDKKSIRSLDSALMSGQNTFKTGPVSERSGGGGKPIVKANILAPDKIGGAKQGGGPPRYRPKSGPITNGAN